MPPATKARRRTPYTVKEFTLRALPYPNLAIAVCLDERPQYIIAAAASVHPNTLNGVLKGRIVPTMKVQHKLATALGRAVSELFDPLEVSV